MHNTLVHRSAVELEQGLVEVLQSPADVGRLEAIVVRPAKNERRTLSTTTLSPEAGVAGDRWSTDSFYRLEDGRSDPRCQVSLMNSRFLRQIAVTDDAMCLAGDNLIVDFDLSESSLPAGSRLAIGSTAVLEITVLPHTGCSKLAARYGQEAREFMNNRRGNSLHLRGRYARVVTRGTISQGDVVRKLTEPSL